jgi:hypothetical protein
MLEVEYSSPVGACPAAILSREGSHGKRNGLPVSDVEADVALAARGTTQLGYSRWAVLKTDLAEQRGSMHLGAAPRVERSTRAEPGEATAPRAPRPHVESRGRCPSYRSGSEAADVGHLIEGRDSRGGSKDNGVLRIVALGRKNYLSVGAPGTACYLLLGSRGPRPCAPFTDSADRRNQSG